MKTISVEFTPGDTCFVMINNVPTETRIRAYRCDGSLEVRKNEKGETIETVVESVVYSTVARPNNPLPADKIGATNEELMKKIFRASSSNSGEEN